jgi:hypothetical protein
MPPYLLQEKLHVLLMFGIGALVTISIALGRGSRTLTFSFRSRRDEDLDRSTAEFEGGIGERDRPVPWLIWLVFFGYFLWAVAYIVTEGRGGL